MGSVLFVPGLQGVQMLARPDGDESTSVTAVNADAVESVALRLGWAFRKAVYQTQQNPAPSLSYMGASVAETLAHALGAEKNEPVILVGSSVGFGVALQALTHVTQTIGPVGLIGYKPISDPLLAIGLQLPRAIVEHLANDQQMIAPMPIETTDGHADYFPLTGRHLADPHALRLLSAPSARHDFNSAGGQSVAACTLIYGDRDHLTPEGFMSKTREALYPIQTRLIAIPGEHGTDLRPHLQQAVEEMILTLR